MSITIRREIEVKRKGLPVVIDVTYGTDLIQMDFKVTDCMIPAESSAVAYSQGRTAEVHKQICTIDENVISFTPEKGFFEEGRNELQLRVVHNNRSLFTFKCRVECQGSFADSDAEEVKRNSSLVEQLMTEQAVTKARLEEVLKLPEDGSDVEKAVNDIKVGAYGKVYSSPGEAVRQQISQVSEQIADVENKIDIIESDFYNGAYIDITDEFTIITGYHAKENGDITSWENGSYSEIRAVSRGEKYKISGCRNNTNCPIVVFYSSETEANKNTFVSYKGGTDEIESGTVVSDYEIIIPNGVKGMVINSAYFSYYTRKIEKYDKRASIKEQEISLRNSFDISNLERRVSKAEKGNDFAWSSFDKAYFVFIHDDLNSFIESVYNAFHVKGVPFCSASIVSNLDNNYSNHTAKEWLDMMVADGGEVLAHWSGDLKETTSDSIWYDKFVMPKKILEEKGFTVRGAMLADSSDRQSNKGEKYCRKYYDYADKVGTSTQYYLDRRMMEDFTPYGGMTSCKNEISQKAQVNGLYLFGFHGNRSDEDWITEDSLKELIDFIKAKPNCEITTISHVYDLIGSSVLEERIKALENK